MKSQLTSHFAAAACGMRSYYVFDVGFWLVVVPLLVTAIVDASAAQQRRRWWSDGITLALCAAIGVVIGFHVWIVWIRYISCNQWLATVPCTQPPSQRHVWLSRRFEIISVICGLAIAIGAWCRVQRPWLRWVVVAMGIAIVLGHGQRLVFFNLQRPTYWSPCA